MKLMFFFLTCLAITLSIHAQTVWTPSTPINLPHYPSVADFKYNVDPNCSDPLAKDEIRKFASRTDRDLNAIVGVPIDYKAKPSASLPNSQWRWDAVSTNGGHPYVLQVGSTSALGYERQGVMERLNISTTSLPVQWDRLGVVNVSATYTAISPATVIQNVKGGRDIRMFFNTHGSNPHSGGNPNWFYYWLQTPPIQAVVQSYPELIVYDVNAAGCPTSRVVPQIIFKYDPNMPYYPGYNNSQPNGTYSVPGAGRGGETDSGKKIAITVDAANFPDCVSKGLSGRLVRNYDPLVITLGPGATLPRDGKKGYFAFVEVVLHELEHALISAKTFAPTGAINDSDGDNYDDDWERNFASNYTNIAQQMQTAQISFSVGQDDSYQDNYAALQCINPAPQGGLPSLGIGANTPGKCNAGSVFEELLARTSGAAFVTTGSNQAAAYDWSFDATPIQLPLPANAPPGAVSNPINLGGLQW